MTAAVDPAAQTATAEPSAPGVGPEAQLLSAPRLQWAGVAVSVVLLLSLVAVYISFLRTGDAGVKRTDYITYYTGGQLVIQGRAGELYDFKAVGRAEKRLVAPLTVRDGVLPFVYPPYVALLFAPLAALPYLASFLLWTAINLGFLVSALWLIRPAGAVSSGATLLYWTAGLSFLPVFVAVAQAQTSILLLFVFTASCVAIINGRQGWSGAFLALALIKPPLVVAPLLCLAVRRQWRALLAFAGGSLALAVVPLLLFGPDVTLGYVRTLKAATGWQQQYGYGPHWNHSLAGFSHLLLSNPAATIAAGLLDIVALAAVVVIARRTADWRLIYGSSVVVALLVSPHVLIHDLTLLLLPAALAVSVRPIGGRGLGFVLAGGYLGILIGLRLIDLAPLQLSVVAMAALAWWFYHRAAKLQERPLALVGTPLPLGNGTKGV